MSTYKHLKRMEKILYKAFEAEILEEQDWFYASKNWEFNFTYEDDHQWVIAYRRYGCNTDWSDYIILTERVRKWEDIA